jgi:hypothetical protein
MPVTSVKSLQSNLKNVRERIAKLSSDEWLLKEALKGVCDHSETTTYTWEHDNGYGRQSKMKGKRCVFCGWLDLWADGRFVDPSECFNDD